jgi:metallo-beta-lactamase class B
MLPLRSVCLLALAVALSPAVSDAAGSRTPLPVAEDIQAYAIAPGVWQFMAWTTLDGSRIPANGLVVVSGRKALLVNTGWTDAQASHIAEWVEKTTGAKVTLVVPTHAHADTIGGLAALHRRGADSWAQEQTATLARAAGRAVPRHLFQRSKDLKVGERVVKLAFHGAGHSPDNIVVWLPEERILFGGCLVKAANASSPGNMEDAKLADWTTTLQAMMAAYPRPTLVIPGHGDAGGLGLLGHTLGIVRAYLPHQK